MGQQLLSLRDLGNKGLNSDIEPWDLPPEFITAGTNFRIFANAIRASGGFETWSVAPEEFFPAYIKHIGATSGDYWLVAGRTAVYAFDGQNWVDISSGDYAGLGLDDELNWTGCELGSIALINNPQHYPEYWAPVSLGRTMQALNFSPTETWQEKGFTFKVLRSHKNFLFALNLQEGLDELPNAYRWSHPADINGLPFTWDETDQSALAGKAQMGGDSGHIIDGFSLRDAFVIYSENAINILDFTPDSPFVWRRRELSSTVGLLNKQCIAEVKGVHFFLADGDILRNDGNSIESITHNRIRRLMNNRMNPDFYHRSYVVKNSALKEIWFCVPEDHAEYPNIAYIYNWKDDSWAIRTIPYETDDTQAEETITDAIAFAGYGPQNEPTETWDEWEGTWAQQTRVWGSRKRTPLDDTIVGVDTLKNSLVVLDPAENITNDIGTRIERTNFPLMGHRQVTTITRIYPHMRGTEDVSIQFGSQDFPDAPIRWKPAVKFNPETDRKIDLRTTGELHCWRVQSIGTGNWSLSSFDIEFTPNGAR